MMKSFRALSLVVSTAVRVSPWQSAVSLGESIANILQVLQPLFLSLLVVGALKHDANRITVAGIAFVASVAVDRICSSLVPMPGSVNLSGSVTRSVRG